MTDLPLGRAAYHRAAAEQPEIKLINRFFEENPTNLVNGSSLLARPPTTLLTTLGSGRVRATFKQEGVFNGDLFVVSGATLYRYTKGGETIAVLGSVGYEGDVSITATDTYLFLADGQSLKYYDGDEVKASETLTITANPSNDETVTVGLIEYTFKTTLTGAANEIFIGVDGEASLQNLIAAINGASGEGSIYGNNTSTNTKAVAELATAATMTVTAINGGAEGNSIVTTETLTNGSWGSSTMSGGVSSTLNTIPTPAGEAIKSVATLAHYVICVVANSQKWFYIEPGEATINALDFYEAEQLPDDIISVKAIGDLVYFFGCDSSEPWYANAAGDADDPFSRSQGSSFSRGIREGSDALVGEDLIVVGNDNIVYSTANGPQRISTHFIEEKIRLAIEAELAAQ